VAVDLRRRGGKPGLSRFTRPVWVTLRLRMLLYWLPGPVLQWIRYLLYYGKLLPLRHPRTFTERLLVKMAYDRNPEQTRTADRIRLRTYVEDRLGPGHLPPLLAVLNTPDDVIGLNLPSRYVAKATHGSQMVHIVRADTPAERQAIARQGRAWLRTRYWRRHGEWAYRGVKPQVIIEGFLGATGDEPPPDWKWYCFAGRAALISFDFDRFAGHRRNFYDRDGEQVDLVLNHRFGPGDERPAPATFARMRTIAERLAAGFEFVRVDLYDVPEGIIVGELTHAPAAGLTVFTPAEWDRRLGDIWGAARGELR
jgi:hypothetical protein